MEWPVVRTETSGEERGQGHEEVSNSTCEVAASFVIQVIVAEFSVILFVSTLEMEGGVVSRGGGVDGEGGGSGTSSAVVSLFIV